MVDGVDLPALLDAGESAGVPLSETMEDIMDSIDFDLSGTANSDDCCCGWRIVFGGVSSLPPK
jgi:hypothetical protein